MNRNISNAKCLKEWLSNKRVSPLHKMVREIREGFVLDIIFVCCVTCWKKSADLAYGLVVAEMTPGDRFRMPST